MPEDLEFTNSAVVRIVAAAFLTIQPGEVWADGPTRFFGAPARQTTRSNILAIRPPPFETADFATLEFTRDRFDRNSSATLSHIHGSDHQASGRTVR
jgi:hypothetical protein